MLKLLTDWRKRHRKLTNLWLHVVGIPACFLAAPVLLICRQWQLALAAFLGGYILQFIGHFLEGNRSGERMLLDRILGRKSQP